MIFYLGTHQPGWLSRTDVPLFVSARRLRRYKTLPVARGAWALDSGGFTELSLHGEWTVPSFVYAMEAQRWQEQIGNLAWAAPQDWMCEPFILEKTGLTVIQHQSRTIANYRELLALAPDVPWVPVLQGWTREDYLHHLQAYRAGGFDLTKVPLVGLGSVCRRQDTAMAEDLIGELSAMGLRLHLFGFKARGLARLSRLPVSADSMAWSYAARRQPPLPGHGRRHKNCANCRVYALAWRERILAKIAGPRQQQLFA